MDLRGLNRVMVNIGMEEKREGKVEVVEGWRQMVERVWGVERV